MRRTGVLAGTLWVSTMALGCGGGADAHAKTEKSPAAAAPAAKVQPPPPVRDEPDAAARVVEVTAAAIATKGNPTLVETLSAARCQRELRCGKVGEDKEHPSLTACRASIATTWTHELNRYRCESEIDRAALSACMQDVQKVDCAKPFESLKSIATCKLGTLCPLSR
jgi:hypothetical protein